MHKKYRPIDRFLSGLVQKKGARLAQHCQNKGREVCDDDGKQKSYGKPPVASSSLAQLNDWSLLIDWRIAVRATRLRKPLSSPATAPPPLHDARPAPPHDPHH